MLIKDTYTEKMLSNVAKDLESSPLIKELKALEEILNAIEENARKCKEERQKQYVMYMARDRQENK